MSRARRRVRSLQKLCKLYSTYKKNVWKSSPSLVLLQFFCSQWMAKSDNNCKMENAPCGNIGFENLRKCAPPSRSWSPSWNCTVRLT